VLFAAFHAVFLTKLGRSPPDGSSTGGPTGRGRLGGTAVAAPGAWLAWIVDLTPAPVGAQRFAGTALRPVPGCVLERARRCRGLPAGPPTNGQALARTAGPTGDRARRLRPDSGSWPVFCRTRNRGVEEVPGGGSKNLSTASVPAGRNPRSSFWIDPEVGGEPGSRRPAPSCLPDVDTRAIGRLRPGAEDAPQAGLRATCPSAGVGHDHQRGRTGSGSRWGGRVPPWRPPARNSASRQLVHGRARTA